MEISVLKVHLIPADRTSFGRNKKGFFCSSFSENSIKVFVVPAVFRCSGSQCFPT